MQHVIVEGCTALFEAAVALFMPRMVYDTVLHTCRNRRRETEGENRTTEFTRAQPAGELKVSTDGVAKVPYLDTQRERERGRGRCVSRRCLVVSSPFPVFGRHKKDRANEGEQEPKPRAPFGPMSGRGGTVGDIVAQIRNDEQALRSGC